MPYTGIIWGYVKVSPIYDPYDGSRTAVFGKVGKRSNRYATRPYEDMYYRQMFMGIDAVPQH